MEDTFFRLIEISVTTLIGYGAISILVWYVKRVKK